MFVEYNNALAARLQTMALAAAEAATVGEFRGYFGSRVRVLMSGGAPLGAEVLALVNRIFAGRGGCRIIDGYGSSETGSIATDNVINSEVAFRLADVPELGFFGTDRPHPRGELLVRTPHLTPGYFRDSGNTSARFTADGYYATGDIVELVGPRKIRVLDRKNNVVKLANGEFAPLEHLEHQLLDHVAGTMAQLCLCPDPTNTFLVCVAVASPPGALEPADALRTLQAAARTKGWPLHHTPQKV